MEVMVSSPPLDYEFGGNRSSPPHFAEYYCSAPSSPTRVSASYREFDYFSTLHARDSSSSSSSIQKSANENNYDEDGDGFAFLVSQESDAASLTAEELFDGGKIKPLKLDQFPPIPLVSQREKGINIGDVLSPEKNKEKEERRGRDRTPAVLCPSSSGRRGARSHSPYRVSQYAWDEKRHHLQQQSAKEESASSTTSKSSSRKWRLRDFLLFRSASEGRGSSKDPLRKYSALDKKPEDAKMRSTDSPAASRRRGPISPHEFHYAIKKAESQDLKKKTYLPYKQGILGRLAGLGSLTR